MLQACNCIWPHFRLARFCFCSKQVNRGIRRSFVPSACAPDPVQMTGSTYRDTSNGPSEQKLLTLAIVNDGARVLHGLKKRGFGEGYYNGFGGKVEEGETIEQAAVRELEEEAGISPIIMTKQGILIFHFDDKPLPWEVHVFNVPEFVGEPCESDEMSPLWFDHEHIPFDKMWKDDLFWYPLFLRGKKFKGEFFFHDTHNLVSHKCEVVDSL